MKDIPTPLLLLHHDGRVGGFSEAWMNQTQCPSGFGTSGWKSCLRFEQGLKAGRQVLTLTNTGKAQVSFSCDISKVKTKQGWYWVTLLGRVPVSRLAESTVSPSSRGPGIFAHSIRQVLENFPNGTVSFLDTGYRFTFIEGQSLKKYGIDPSKVLGKHIRDILQVQEFEHTWPYYQRAMNGEPVEFEFIFKEKFHYWFSCFPLYDHQNQISGITILNWEISELKHQEQRIRQQSLLLREILEDRTTQLSQSRERFDSLTESVPAIIWGTDADGHREFTNQEWSSYTGLREEDFDEATYWMEVIHPDDLSTFLLELEDARLGQRSCEWEYRLKGKDDQYRWFRGKATPQIIDGMFSGLIGAEMDIQGMKDIEQKLLSSTRELANNHLELEELSFILFQEIEQELEELNRSLSVLKAVQEQEEDPASAQLILARALDQTASILKLIQGSNRYSQVSHLKISGQQHRLDVLIRNILRFILKEDGTDVEDCLVVHEHPEVEADPKLLETMLTCILQNCVDFRKPDGELLIEFGMRIMNKREVYYLQDHGVGLAHGEASLLFDLFYCGRGSDKGDHRGLGLATARRCALRLGGDMWAEGERGVGTTIYFSLKGGR